jgi:phosphatidylserine/phosphatidylglycerophosphate/cardiolipin synthase-like enzyme
MRPSVCLTFVLLFAIGCSSAKLASLSEHAVAKQPAVVEDAIDVYFSPEGGATAAILREIAQARQTIDVQAYLITAKGIIDALEAAHARGVKVRIILDNSNPGGVFSAVAYFSKSSIPVWRDGKHKGMHAKVMLIDGQTIITGSFNFTDESETNAENLLIIHNKPKLFAAYEADFARHLEHSDPPPPSKR